MAHSTAAKPFCCQWRWPQRCLCAHYVSGLPFTFYSRHRSICRGCCRQRWSYRDLAFTSMYGHKRLISASSPLIIPTCRYSLSDVTHSLSLATKERTLNLFRFAGHRQFRVIPLACCHRRADSDSTCENPMVNGALGYRRHG